MSSTMPSRCRLLIFVGVGNRVAKAVPVSRYPVQAVSPEPVDGTEPEFAAPLCQN